MLRHMSIRLVVAEDSYLIREGLTLLLAEDQELDLVAAVASLPELEDVVATAEPDVVMTDIRMPPTGTISIRSSRFPSPRPPSTSSRSKP